MTGNIVLDVVIGLVFIYLLYSLLASIIQEMIANFFGLRARNLKQGIVRMLEDGPDRSNKNIVSDVLSDVMGSFLRIFSNTETGLLKSFYDQPSIKYLASGKFFSKPSYINKTNFSKALMDILKEEGEGDTDLDRIKAVLNGGENKSELLVDIRKKIKENVEDTNKINDLKVLLTDTGKASLINDNTRKHIRSLLIDSQDDLMKFKASLEDWFNETMERATGWYKRTTQLILLIIGLTLAITFNVNSIEIVNLLANDKDARENMVNMASTYVKENKELIDGMRRLKTPITDSIHPTIKEYNANLDSLLKIKEDLQEDINKVNQIMGFQPEDSFFAKKLTTKCADSISRLLSNKQVLYDDNYLVEFPSAYLADNTSNYYDITSAKVENNKTYYAKFNRLGYIWDNMWGYLITALAISLGAPFWFDLLNKLIKMRSSIQKGTQSTADKVKNPQGNTSINKRVG
jgi:CRISPR/Cas system CMR-associated protein Cmr5 small subunit